jgi:cytochrome c oxidase subunit 1
VTAFLFFFIGGILASIIRVELATPASDLVSPETYNRVFTMHGTIMIFLWVVPAGTGAFANYLIPLMIGAKDMAFPKLNAVAFWMNSSWRTVAPLQLFCGTRRGGLDFLSALEHHR